MKNLILIILTSHRQDCFSLCLHNLEKYTDLQRFKCIYILANDVDDDHKIIINAFKIRHKNVIDVHFSPRDIYATIATEGFILENNRNNVIVKLDEDVFVTAGWLDSMLEAYKATLSSRIILISALVPNNQIGKNCLHTLFLQRFPSYTKEMWTNPAHRNYKYAEWIWQQFLSGHLRDATCPIISACEPFPFQNHLNINCILFDHRMMDLVLPFKTTDENAMNMALQENNLLGLMLPSAVAHHYSFKDQQRYLDAQIGPAAIARVFGLNMA